MERFKISAASEQVSPQRKAKCRVITMLTHTNFQVTRSAEVLPCIAKEMSVSYCSQFVKTWFSDKCTKV